MTTSLELEAAGDELYEAVRRWEHEKSIGEKSMCDLVSCQNLADEIVAGIQKLREELGLT